MTSIKPSRIKTNHTNFITSFIFLTIIFAIGIISTVIFNEYSISINNIEGFNNTNTNTNNNNTFVTTYPFDFMRYNISAPECCKYSSGYSNSTGCICITPTQEKILDSRGSSY